MKADCIPDSIKHLFTGFPLPIAPLEFRAECGVSLFIFFYYYGKPEIVHSESPTGEYLSSTTAITF
jgi:hypothetical protein